MGRLLFSLISSGKMKVSIFTTQYIVAIFETVTVRRYSISEKNNLSIGKMKTPNIIEIICHDLGRHLNCYGWNSVKTPNLDACSALCIENPEFIYPSRLVAVSAGDGQAYCRNDNLGKYVATPAKIIPCNFNDRPPFAIF